MRHVILFAGAAALGLTAAAANAKPPHAGHPGKGKGQQVRILNDHNQGRGYGVGGCPPGLAKKIPPCVPPGIARQQFQLGQRIPLGYRGLLGYDALPYHLRTHYGAQLDPRSRYIYDNSYLYRVDPATMMVRQILGAVLRPY